MNRKQSQEKSEKQSAYTGTERKALNMYIQCQGQIEFIKKHFPTLLK